jgi:flagellar hook protein FlgE
MTPISSFTGSTLGYQPRMEIPVKGMQRAASSMNEAAMRIGDGDLNPQSFVKMMGAKYSFQANAAVLKTMDETLGTLLDTIA